MHAALHDEPHGTRAHRSAQRKDHAAQVGGTGHQVNLRQQLEASIYTRWLKIDEQLTPLAALSSCCLTDGIF
jgi:hypothetical protein